MPNRGPAQAKLAGDICASITCHAAHNGGHVHIAEMMGLNYSTWHNTLFRNANPIQDDLARLAVYMRVTGNLEPLRLVADYCGYFLERKPNFENDEHSLQHESIILTKEAADFAAEYEERAKDGIDEKDNKYLRRKIRGMHDHAEEIEAKFEGAGK